MGSRVSRSTSRTSVNVLSVSWLDVFASWNAVVASGRGGGVLRTALRDLGECQASTSLQIDVFGEDKCTQGSKRFSCEEIGLAALIRRVSNDDEHEGQGSR